MDMQHQKTLAHANVAEMELAPASSAIRVRVG